ncbi:MAG: hypothetical protein Fur0025_36730 [Oscillatoriaceae cyanobacterium]
MATNCSYRLQTIEYAIVAYWNYGDIWNFDGIYFWCELDIASVNNPIRKDNPNQCPKYDEVLLPND